MTPSAENDLSIAGIASAEKCDSLERSTDLRDALINICLVFIVALTMGGTGHFLNRATAPLIIIGAILQSVTHLILFFRRPGATQYRSGRDFLVAERNWISLRIRTFRVGYWCTTAALTACACFILYFTPSARDSLRALGAAAVLLAALQVTHFFQVRKPLSTRLAALDRRLAGLAL